MTDDPRVSAARYRIERLAAAHPPEEGGPADPPVSAADAPQTRPRDAPVPTAADRAAYVEVAIQQAMRSGDFDRLPGAGRPIPDLGDHHDPDWWIRRKIQSERLTGLGPPALLLRVESAELVHRLDELHRESDVRETLEDFNRRVIEARRQLLGGPPVVTSLRDVDAELAQWHARRRARTSSDDEADAEAAAPPRRRRFRRRGAARGQR